MNNNSTMAKRLTFTLNDGQQAQLRAFSRGSALQRDAKEARDWWGQVAHLNGIDPGSIIHSSIDSTKFTALPIGHGKHWCWPSPLQMIVRPEQVLKVSKL